MTQWHWSFSTTLTIPNQLSGEPNNSQLGHATQYKCKKQMERNEEDQLGFFSWIH